MVFQYISNKMQRCTVYIWKLLYMFRVVLPPIIRSAYNCIYSNWYLSHRYCYLPPSWKSWNKFECAVGGVRHPQHTQTSSNSSTIAPITVTVWQIPDSVDTVVCAFDDEWKYHPKQVEQFPDINKLCNVASCWIYSYIRILLWARPILHVSRIRVNCLFCMLVITRLLLVSQVSVEFTKILRTGDLWKEVFNAKMYLSYPIFNSFFRMIKFMAQKIFEINKPVKFGVYKNMTKIPIFFR
jgi:hypothetical protein